MHTSHVRVGVLTIGLAALVTAWGLVAPPEEVPSGLLGRYFANDDWSGEPFLERVDQDPNTDTLAVTSELAGRDRFSVEWTGSLVVRRDAIHRFATKSDDGTWLWIDDQLVIDNGGTHAARNVWAELPLTRGVHRFKLRYSQAGGDSFLQIGQTGRAGQMRPPGPLVPLTLSYDELRRRELWALVIVLAWYCAAFAVVIASLARVRHLPVVGDVAAIWADIPIRVIVLLGMALSAAHIAYGLPAIPSFSVDELEPLDTLVASQSGFRDWNLRWPPLHAFLIALSLQPFWWAEAWFGLPLQDDVVVAAMFLVTRGLSVMCVGLTLLLTFDATRLVAGPRAGRFAAALLATSPLVVYFGSRGNLEIPHLFWVTLTFWVWLKLWQHRHLYWFAVLGAAVGLSLAAKDQAYGYYVLAPVALVVLVWQDWRARNRSWLRVLGDRRLVFAALAAVAAMVIGHALPWRLDRFVERLTRMPSLSAQFQTFAASFDGYVALLVATAKSFWWAAGAPLVAALLVGLVSAARGRQGLVFAMLLPAVTYSLTFLAVILYVYDRFLIGWLPIAAAIGGIGLSTLSRARLRGQPLGAVVVAAIVAAGVVNGLAVGVVFQRDPRHRAWRWVEANLPCGSSVGVTFNSNYVPPLACHDLWTLTPGALPGMARWPRYLVLNEAYVERFRHTPDGGRFLVDLSSGALGYRRLVRVESTPPVWAPLYWEPRFWNGVEDIETTSDKPLHAIEVWECVERAGCDRLDPG